MFRFSNLYLFIVFFLALFSFFAGYYFYYSKQDYLTSPITSFYKIDFSDNQWFPKTLAESNENEVSKVTAKAAFFVETQSGKVLYQKNENEKLPIASLNKIMTAILVMENFKLSDTFTVSERAASMEPDKMLLIAGEKLTTEELLYGIFLVSANDAAEVIAENLTGRREEFNSSEESRSTQRAEFIALMNLKAKQLGMSNTYFLNPTGLEEDNKSQYSTAFDVALMSRYAINKWSELLKISSKDYIYLPKTETHQDYDMYSGINLLTTYPGVLGFKTGFTPQAGLTLVTVARKGDKQVLGVILGSTSRRDDAKVLLDYSFKQLGL